MRPSDVNIGGMPTNLPCMCCLVVVGSPSIPISPLYIKSTVPSGPFVRLRQWLFSGCVESAMPFSLASQDRLLGQVLLLLLLPLLHLALELVLLLPLEFVPVDVAAMFDFLVVDEMMKILGLQ